MKKAEGLSLQTIAVAAIVLLVIIIVFAVFSGGINKILPSINKANECTEFPPDYGCKKAGECTKGVEVYGLGCDENEKNKAEGKVYCCKKGQNA